MLGNGEKLTSEFRANSKRNWSEKKRETRAKLDRVLLCLAMSVYTVFYKKHIDKNHQPENRQIIKSALRIIASQFL